jgi:hypothetical protein
MINHVVSNWLDPRGENYIFLIPREGDESMEIVQAEATQISCPIGDVANDMHVEMAKREERKTDSYQKTK